MLGLGGILDASLTLYALQGFATKESPLFACKSIVSKIPSEYWRKK